MNLKCRHGFALILALFAALAAPHQAAAAADCPGTCTGKSPAYADPAYAAFTGQVAIATCYANLPSDPVLAVIDLQNQAAAPLNTSWNAPAYHAPNWTRANLGNVFGLTLDNGGNIYLTATSSFANDVFAAGGPGGVYRIDAVSGAVSVFAMLPNGGPALGNIHYDATFDSFYVTNFDDGLIVRLDASGTAVGQWDHGANLPTPLPDDPTQLATPLGRRVWGVHTLANRLYYSVWWEDQGVAANPTQSNEVWSVALDAAGDFVAGSAQLEVTLPALPARTYSNPVADINFGPTGNLLLAERTMGDLTNPGAHESRGLEYVRSGPAWIPSPHVFKVSQLYPPGSAAGGVDQDFGPGGRVWFSGDALHVLAADLIYGLQGLPALGGDITTSILIDLNGNISEFNKTQIGDVAVTCPAGLLPSEDIDVSLSTGFDENTGHTLSRGTADDDWTAQVGVDPTQPALLVVQPAPVWPRFRPSQWISDNFLGSSPEAGGVHYERCFCIAADATNAKLTMRLWADDVATVRLNGQVIAGPGGQFRKQKPLAVVYMGTVGASFFKPGTNCVAVDVADIGQTWGGLDVTGNVWIDHGRCAGASY